MGYNTIFKGELKFTTELKSTALAKLYLMLNQDCRDHPEWKDSGGEGLYYIDLVLLDDFSGLKWNDAAEKTYHLDKIVNLVIKEMRKEFPEFGLKGKLFAQGDDIEDRWELIIDKDGFAKHVKIPMTGQKITCPHCEKEFFLEDKKKR